jgi:nicotinamidase-related amidase
MEDNNNKNNNSSKPAKKVLVVIDMQTDFLTGSLGGEHCRRAIPGCESLLQKVANGEDGFVGAVFTLDTHNDDYLETLEGKKLPVVHCIEGTKGHKVCDELTGVVARARLSIPSDEKKFAYVLKDTFGSRDQLWETVWSLADNNGANLDNIEVHFCGVCTSICVLANAVICRALRPNTRIVIHADACGDVNEGMHQHALECLRAQQCDIVGD